MPEAKEAKAASCPQHCRLVLISYLGIGPYVLQLMHNCGSDGETDTVID